MTQMVGVLPVEWLSLAQLAQGDGLRAPTGQYWLDVPPLGEDADSTVRGVPMQEALLVFIGAIVGGLMSALASNWSSRRQYLRETRVDIFRRLLPMVHDGGPDQPRPLAAAETSWEELFRAAESLGGQDWRHGARLEHLVRDWDQCLVAARRGGPVDGDCICDEEMDARASRLQVQIRRALSAYEVWLRRRLAGFTRGPHPLLR